MSAALLLSVLEAYLAIGVVFALVLVAIAGRVDPAARGAYLFRLLIIPGAALLWPILIVKLLTRRAAAPHAPKSSS